MNRSDIENVQTWVSEMVDNDYDRNSLWSSIDDMFHGDYELPKTLKDKKIEKVVSLVPHDALNAATKAYSGLSPRFRVKPMSGQQVEKARARQIGEAIKWQFQLANQRRRVLWDVVHASMRYDAIVGRIELIPFLYKNDKRAKKAKGMFDVELFHPMYAHSEEGKFGLEKVALVTNHSLDKVITTWEKRKDVDESVIANLKELLEKDEDLRFHLADATYWDDDEIWQTVYGMTTTEESTASRDSNFKAEHVLYHKKLDIPFINWICKYGGTNLEMDTSDFRVHPLLAPLVWTNAWDNLNIKKSLLNDEVIKYAEAPRRVNKTWNREGVEVDYEHGSDINLNPQESSEVQQPPTIDTALLQLVKDAETEIQNTTIASVLYNLANTMGDAPYSTTAAIIQNTLSSLTPQKNLAESFLEAMSCMFMEWCAYAEMPITGYSSMSMNGAPAGSEIIISPDDYDVNDLFITAELRADNPMDEMQRINMGVMKNQRLKIPLLDIHDELGYDDPEERMDQWMNEKMDEVELGNVVSEMQAETQLQIQQAQMEMQMQAQQAMQGQQMGTPPSATPEQGGGGFPSDQQGMTAAFDQTRGQNFNPNAGGQSPMTAASPMGREQITGETAAGGATLE
jgi:hypothetical protein